MTLKNNINALLDKVYIYLTDMHNQRYFLFVNHRYRYVDMSVYDIGICERLCYNTTVTEGDTTYGKQNILLCPGIQ